MKPIFFNTDMVRAILDGRKTVTRRVVKPQPEKSSHSPYECVGGRFAFRIGERACTEKYKPPYRPGDILYVRETWVKQFGLYWHKAGLVLDENERWHGTVPPSKWRSSTSMPREAAQLFLRVTNVRVERLQDITKEQALSEGVPDDSDYPLDNHVYCPKCKGEGIIGAIHPESLGYMETDCPYCDTPQKRFSHLWYSTIKKPADRAIYGWTANPWVWVIEFKRCEKPKEDTPC